MDVIFEVWNDALCWVLCLSKVQVCVICFTKSTSVCTPAVWEQLNVVEQHKQQQTDKCMSKHFTL